MNIGIIGAGIMGCGVAQRFASYGFHVILLDLTDEKLQKAAEMVRTNYRMSRLLKQNINGEEFTANISYTCNYRELSDCEYIVENVSENIEMKRTVYERLEEVCAPGSIYLANTSCISITKIAGFTERREQVLGVHFMNPVPLKKAAEVIRGYHTSEDTLKRVRHLLDTVNIQPIVVKDFPGFVSNRVSHLMMNEAANIVQDGVASPEQVDEIFRLCFEHKMGPLETADLIGLDTVVDSLNVLYESYQDSKYRVSPLLRKMVEAGLNGRKSGEGFYQY